MDTLKSILFFLFSSMIDIQILGGGGVEIPSLGNQSKERLILFKKSFKMMMKIRNPFCIGGS